jgi:hypothetical protein
VVPKSSSTTVMSTSSTPSVRKTPSALAIAASSVELATTGAVGSPHGLAMVGCVVHGVDIDSYHRCSLT